MGPEPLDRLPDAVFVIDGERIRIVNRRGAEMLGRDEAWLLGRNLSEVLAPGEPERLSALLGQQDGGWVPPTTFRLRFVCADGREVPADVRFERSGASLVLAARDMTEARRGEALVARLAEIVGRVIVTGGADALLDAGEPIFLELGWTVAYSAIDGDATIPLRVLGREDDPIAAYGRSIVGRHLTFAESPIAGEVARTQRPIFLDNLPTLSVGRARDATSLDASMRQAHVRRSVWCPIFHGEQLTHLLSVAGADMTEHDFVAVQLFAAQIGAASRAAELQTEVLHRERLAAMGRMSAVLAHEIRTPIAVIFNALAALRHPSEQSDESALHAIIGEEAERLRAVTTDILDFARPREPRIETVGIREIVDEAIFAALQHPAVKKSSPRPQVSIAPEASNVRADPELLRRAIVNLVVNALTHSRAGAVVRIDAAREADEVRVTVFNEGAPISAEAALRVFEPFFTTRSEGIGLGLFVVRRAVEACGGRVELETVQNGVQFSAHLKAAA